MNYIYIKAPLPEHWKWIYRSTPDIELSICNMFSSKDIILL